MSFMRNSPTGKEKAFSMKSIKISRQTKENMVGVFYLSPFLIGLCLFFLFPIVTSILLSFGDLDSTKATFAIALQGLNNYRKAFFTDVNFVPRLLEVIKTTLINSPLIVIFSLILAVMLSKIDHCKGFFRVVLLLPFVLGTGEVMAQLLTQGVDKQIISLSNSSIIPREWLLYLGQDFVEMLDMLFSSIIRLLWQSSVQIILFLSAILGISPALYESAKIDGANEYEIFWKITLPMVSPILMLNLVYTIIASFTDSSNRVLEYISEQTVKYGMHGYASALGWIYFAFILLLIGSIILVIGSYVRKNQGYGR